MIGAFLRRAINDKSGNVAILFGLTALGMIGIVGIGIDASRAMATKSVLDASADAAALAAVTQAQATLQSSNALYANNAALAILAGQTAGTNVFQADATKVGNTIGGTPTPTVLVVQSTVNGKNVLTATVTYQASSPNVFGPIFGSKSVPLTGTAKSSLTLPSYMNISVLADISQSMGLAATSTDMTNLANLTPDHCAFGCHVVSQDQASQGAYWSATPYEQVAHANGVTLRIDVVRSATQNMIQTAKGMALSPPLISFGLYTLQAAQPSKGLPGPAFTTLASPSTSYDSLTTAATGIDLGTNTSAGIGDSDDATSMQQITSTIPANGNGTKNAPLQFLFLMTDGVQDVWCQGGYGSHCTQAFDPSLCTALKAKGVTIGVIYTTYLQMNGDSRYNALVASFASQIGPNLQACASTGWYYQATDASDIQAAVNALFAQATGHGILTQ